MATPAPGGGGPDAPAGATPPSARYTPGNAAVSGGLLAGFTPSPAPANAGARPYRPPGMPVMGAPQPPEPAAGGPQVPGAAPKPAFAAWAARATQQGQQGQQGAELRRAGSYASSDAGDAVEAAAVPAGGARTKPLKHPCLACGAAEAVHIHVVRPPDVGCWAKVCG